MDCLFCALIAGEIPSKRVYEDDAALAWLREDELDDGLDCQLRRVVREHAKSNPGHNTAETQHHRH